jgi:DNA-binding NarL/FixJ family response regulator
MRVLIADDHPLFVDGVCSLLEAHGIEVAATVGDGQAAVIEALRLEPDLVLMDIRMPRGSSLSASPPLSGSPSARRMCCAWSRPD